MNQNIKEIPRFSIGELANRADCKVQTIRYYEQIGILPHPARTEGGQRKYAAGHLSRLLFVRRSRDLGFSLDTVRQLLRLADKQEDDCAIVDGIATVHLQEVRQKINHLRTLEKELKRMISECSHGKISDCQIIQVLAGDNAI